MSKKITYFCTLVTSSLNTARSCRLWAIIEIVICEARRHSKSEEEKIYSTAKVSREAPAIYLYAVGNVLLQRPIATICIDLFFFSKVF